MLHKPVLASFTMLITVQHFLIVTIMRRTSYNQSRATEGLRVCPDHMQDMAFDTPIAIVFKFWWKLQFCSNVVSLGISCSFSISSGFGGKTEITKSTNSWNSSTPLASSLARRLSQYSIICRTISTIKTNDKKRKRKSRIILFGILCKLR